MAASTQTVIRRNLPYLRQQLAAALGNSSVVVKFICVAVFFCYFLSFTESGLDVLSVTPGYLLPPNFRLWTAFTYCFLETRFWRVAIDVITVGMCGKLIEPLWGALEMLTFFAVVNLSVAVVCVAVAWIAYMATFDTDVLFTVHINGLAGYLAAVSVAVKQIMPDHVLVNTALGKIRNRNVPLNILLLAVLLWLIGMLDGTYPIMFAAGLLSGWVYLRFVQYHSNGTRGDMAEGFVFASFFPNVMQPPVAIVCNTIFHFLVRIKVCRKQVRKYDVGAPSSITISLPGTDSHDAERRRQIALKALSERLNKADQVQTWPSMAGEESPTKKKSAKSVAFSKLTTSTAGASSHTSVRINESSGQSSSASGVLNPAVSSLAASITSSKGVVNPTDGQ